jgi:hypothetical protein
VDAQVTKIKVTKCYSLTKIKVTKCYRLTKIKVTKCYRLTKIKVTKMIPWTHKWACASLRLVTGLGVIMRTIYSNKSSNEPRADNTVLTTRDKSDNTVLTTRDKE